MQLVINYNIIIRGGNQYNFGLSRRRAESVKAKLLEFGLAESRIAEIEAMGEEQPIATNDTEEGRAQNRRVEFKLVQRENKQRAKMGNNNLYKVENTLHSIAKRSEPLTTGHYLFLIS